MNEDELIEPTKEQLDEADLFVDKYKPEDNPFANSGFIYECSGNEAEYVKAVADNALNRVWTLIDGEDGFLYVSAGMHFVNRIGYVVTEVPWETGMEEYFYG